MRAACSASELPPEGKVGTNLCLQSNCLCRPASQLSPQFGLNYTQVVPASVQAKCDRDVTDLFAALDSLLHDVDAQGVCSVFDFCAQPQGR